MTEHEAREWIVARHGKRGAERLEKVSSLVLAETARQNLIAPSTVATMWNRHLVDSAQLLALLPPATNADRWIDIGSGAGFPGLVIASLSDSTVVLVEPRKRRAAFLEQAVSELGLSNVQVICDRMDNVRIEASIISARAVASLSTMLGWAYACAAPQTRWVFPKGRSAREEVATAQQAWHGMFHVEHSITDPESMIVLASGVTRR